MIADPLTRARVYAINQQAAERRDLRIQKKMTELYESLIRLQFRSEREKAEEVISVVRQTAEHYVDNTRDPS